MIMKEIRSLDDLVGFYVKLGYAGFNLKNMLEKDKRYSRLLRGRKEDLTKMGISGSEQKKYVLLTDRDIEMLRRCNALQKIAKKEDVQTVKLIKSQLEDDWRVPLLSELKRLERKYK